MPLAPGACLGPYEIQSLLGAGGMGEVYKAKDTRLSRTVAIKVLPLHLRDTPDLKQRFDREAQAIAALEHPHICVLYDIGHDGGMDFLVMEYLEGQTLAERLETGALPLDQALQHAIQISEALDAAHEKGIVHRDLKPGNIMLTKNGVKLLDFDSQARTCCASRYRRNDERGHQTSPHRTRHHSRTLQYMAPEQVEAQPTRDSHCIRRPALRDGDRKGAFGGRASVLIPDRELSPPDLSIQPMAPASLIESSTSVSPKIRRIAGSPRTTSPAISAGFKKVGSGVGWGGLEPRSGFRSRSEWPGPPRVFSC